jgi:hypothetical protein
VKIGGRFIGLSDEEMDRRWRIMRLATYNSERDRGLVHTDEWREFMAAEQAWFDGLPAPYEKEASA